MQLIKQAVEKVVSEWGDFEMEVKLERPKDEQNGDWSSNVAMRLAKQMGKQPRELAEKLLVALQSNKELSAIVDEIKVAGAGFVNFKLKDDYWRQVIKRAVKDDYGTNEIGKGKRVIVEYSSPNIAKPFTVGHLRSTVIGDAVANILEMNGWQVWRDNHIGDWGTQFGKQIVAIKKWGEVGKTDYTVKELVALYVKFHQEAEKDKDLIIEAREWFQKLEAGDKEAREIWRRCVESSWVEFERIYKLLGVRFSREFNRGRGLGESFFENKMQVVVDELESKDLLREGEGGAKLVFFPDDKYPPAMILKSDGSTLYHTRDLATDKYRLEKYRPDLIINEVGAEQSLYFKQLFEIEEMLGWYVEGQRVHIGHGMIRFKEGKMSTRKGNVIWLSEVLDEVIKRAGKLQKGSKQKRLAEVVGIGALKWNDLKGEAKREVVFDWQIMLNMKGDSGPYVQYTYARARSVLRRMEEEELRIESYELIGDELGLVRWLDRYPEVVREAGERLAPHLVANYAYELAMRFNSFYNQCQILGDEREILRVELTKAVSRVLKSGLGLLGIKVVEEM